MTNLNLLKKEFQNSKIEFGSEIFDNLSTKTDDGKIFSPYIPFVGEKYNELKILVYSTAQNIKYDWYRELYQNNYDKLTERLYYFENFNKKYPEKGMSFRDIGINPYGTGVVAALLGVFIFAKFGKIIESLDDINNWIGITNYYKFSLNNRKTDINPETNIFNFIKDKSQIEKYWSVNDELVKKELNTLKPNFILSFNGRKLKQIKQFSENGCDIIRINDPSWILQGGSGVFKENRSWWKKAANCNDNEINDLVDNYLKYIGGNYSGKKESVRIYLLKYYSDWKK